MRHTLEMKTVATLRKGLAYGRRPARALIINTTRARFFRQMDKLGFNGMDAYRAFRDCLDVAELENMAESAA